MLQIGNLLTWLCFLVFRVVRFWHLWVNKLMKHPCNTPFHGPHPYRIAVKVCCIGQLFFSNGMLVVSSVGKPNDIFFLENWSHAYVMKSQGSRSYVDIALVCKAHDWPVFQCCKTQSLCSLQAMKNRSAKSTKKIICYLLRQLCIRPPVQSSRPGQLRIKIHHQAQVLPEQILQQMAKPKEEWLSYLKFGKIRRRVVKRDNQEKPNVSSRIFIKKTTTLQ